MAITGAGRLVLTSYDFTWQDAARVYRGFDIAAARCSYAQDADFIYAGIKERYGASVSALPYRPMPLGRATSRWGRPRALFNGKRS